MPSRAEYKAQRDAALQSAITKWKTGGKKKEDLDSALETEKIVSAQEKDDKLPPLTSDMIDKMRKKPKPTKEGLLKKIMNLLDTKE